MFETHPFVGDPVEGRGLDIFVSITAQGLLGMIIGKDQQNVGLFCVWCRVQVINPIMDRTNLILGIIAASSDLFQLSVLIKGIGRF